MRARWLALVSLVLAAGCGEAKWNPDLKLDDTLEAGAPFPQALEKHGGPDSVQEIDSDTFTVSWSRSRVIAVAPFFSRRERTELCYLVRKGKLGPPSSSSATSEGAGVGFGADATGPARSTAGTLGLIPLFAVLVAWRLGRTFREHARHQVAPLALVSLLLLGTSWGSERSGVTSSEGSVAGSHSSELVKDLGAPTRIMKLPGENGALLVYETRESKHRILGGAETASTQTYLVQRGRIVAGPSKSTAFEAQYYLFPFFETHEARLHATIAWSVALGTLALALATRRKKVAEPTPPPGV